MTKSDSTFTLMDTKQLQKTAPVVPPRSWESNTYTVIVSAACPEVSVQLPVEGGSDCGRFCSIGQLKTSDPRIIYHSPRRPAAGDVLLEIGDYQVAGYTNLETAALIKTLSRVTTQADRPRVPIKLVPRSALPDDHAQLNHFLSAQFPVGSPEFLLQEVTRNNIYQRVVPCKFYCCQFFLKHKKSSCICDSPLRDECLFLYAFMTLNRKFVTMKSLLYTVVNTLSKTLKRISFSIQSKLSLYYTYIFILPFLGVLM